MGDGRGALWVVIAAFNEAAVIESVVRDLRRKYAHIVVVDDGSHDDTAAAARRGRATVLRHCVNLGQGAALKTGMSYALLKGADTIVTFDGDGQHRVEDIATLIEMQAQTGADVVIGSRFLGEAQNIPPARRMMLKLAVAFMRWRTGVQLTDAHNGLRLLTARAAQLIEISQTRMAHASEIIDNIQRHRLGVAEAPVTILYTPYSLQKGQRIIHALDVLFEMFVARINQ